MKIIALIHIVLIVVASQLLFGSFGLAALLSDFYQDDSIRTAGGFPEQGTIPFWSMMAGRMEHFLPYSILIFLIAVFPIALLLTLPRAIGLLMGRSPKIAPRWISLIHMAIVMIGFLVSAGAFFLVWIASDRPSVPLGAFAVACVTGTVILEAFLSARGHRNSNRESGPGE